VCFLASCTVRRSWYGVPALRIAMVVLVRRSRVVSTSWESPLWKAPFMLCSNRAIASPGCLRRDDHLDGFFTAFRKIGGIDQKHYILRWVCKYEDKSSYVDEDYPQCLHQFGNSRLDIQTIFQAKINRYTNLSKIPILQALRRNATIWCSTPTVLRFRC
jgi:hypothetical protein